MLQLSADAYFAPEPFDAHCRRHLRVQHLHDDCAAERNFLSDEDATHATAAELALDPVGITQSFLKLFA